MNDSKEIKTGVVGIGAMGSNHARIYSQKSNLVGVSDLDEEKGRKIAKDYKVKYFKDYNTLFKKVDAVSIAVPTFLHEKVAIDAFDNGLNVLLEKPISDKLESARRIIEASKRSKKILMIGQIERYNPAVQELKRMLDSGKYGEIISISARRFSPYPRRITDVGVLHDLTIHDIDVLRYLTGNEISYVKAVGNSTKGNLEDSVCLVLKFREGQIGVCETSWLNPGRVRNLVITTTECYISLNFLNQEITIISNKPDIDSNSEIVEEKISIEYSEPLKNEILDFLSSIHNSTSPLVTGEEGLANLIVIEDANKAIKNIDF